MIKGLRATMALLAVTMLTTLAAVPAGAENGDTTWSEVSEPLGDGGVFTTELTAGQWRIYGTSSTVYGPGWGNGWQTLDIRGLRLTTSDDCQHFRGVAGSGTLTLRGDTRTYHLINVAVNLDPASGMTLTGLWLDNTGRSGAFGAWGWTNGILVHGQDSLPDYCRVFVIESAFAQDNRPPLELLEDLVLEEVDQDTVNDPPQIPTLELPQDDQVFLPREVQLFGIRTTDPDGDAYFGQIAVRRPNSEIFDPDWATAPAPSGESALGTPPEQYPVVAGLYTWKARASDGQLASDYSGTRDFRVGLPTALQNLAENEAVPQNVL